MTVMGDFEARIEEVRRLLSAHPAAALDAVAHARTALPSVPEAQRRSAELAVDVAEVRALNQLGRYADGLLRTTEVLHGVQAAVQLADDRVGELFQLRAAAFSRLGHAEAALEALDEGDEWASSTGATPAAAARLASERASVLRRAGRVAEAAAAFDRLLGTEGVDDDRRLAVAARLNAASTYWQVGRAEEAAELLAVTARLLRDRPSPELEGWQLALSAWVVGALGDHPAAIIHARRAEAVRHADVGARVSAIRARARALSHLGPRGVVEAEGALRGLLLRCDEEGWAEQAVFVCRELGEVLARGQRFEEAYVWTGRAMDRHRDVVTRGGAGIRRAEQLRRDLSIARLEAEQLREHNAALAALSDDLRRMGEDRARLLRTVSHDLRSPLTAMLCTIDVHPAPDETLDILEDAAERMRSVIDRALSLDAIERGAPDLRVERVDLVEVCRRLRLGMSSLAQRKSIDVRIEGPHALVVETDPTAFGRVIENLLSNALKFSPPGTRVKIELAVRSDSVVVTVRDQGPGFSEAELESVFEYGRTAGARPTAGESTSGLGLHVARQLVNALGGAVRAANHSEGGAELTVELPLHDAHRRSA